jgi:hypothetical protein
MEIGTEKENPIWMALVPVKPKLKDAIALTLISVAPIVLAILMQRPALRQAIKMRTLHFTKEYCQEIADVFQILATKSAQEYQKVQL